MREDFKKKFDERLYSYSINLIRFLDTLPKDVVSVTMVRQLVRSGTSVAANVKEARGASSKKDYINFYTHALKSANESSFWLRLIKDTRKVSSRVDLILQEAKEIANILGASIITMKKNK
jgi:four helix bundle protein